MIAAIASLCFFQYLRCTALMYLHNMGPLKVDTLVVTHKRRVRPTLEEMNVHIRSRLHELISLETSAETSCLLTLHFLHRLQVDFAQYGPLKFTEMQLKSLGKGRSVLAFTCA